MCQEGILLFEILGGKVYAYGAALSIGVLLAVCLMYFGCFPRAYAPADDRPCAVMLTLCILPFALIGARLMYCVTRLNGVMSDLGPAFIPKLWFGGYSIVGAMLGGTLGAWLYARAKKLSFAKLLDAAIPGALLVIAIARGAEAFTSQGLGDIMDSEALCFFPFGVGDEWGDFYIPVFFWEALAALCILIYALLRQQKGRLDGTALMALLLLCASQVFLESLREDDSIRFGFVRFNQLISVAGILGITLLLAHQRKTPRPVLTKRLIVFFVLVALMIGIEFALDKTMLNHVFLYAVMIASLSVCCRMAVTLPKAPQTAEA